MRYPDLFALNPRLGTYPGAPRYTIVAHMLRYVMLKGYVISDDFTQERCRHTPTSYGTYGSFAKYMDDMTKPCGRQQATTLPLIRRELLLNRKQRSMLTWIGPERPQWIALQRPTWRDRVLQDLESRLTIDPGLTEEEQLWLDCLR